MKIFIPVIAFCCLLFSCTQHDDTVKTRAKKTIDQRWLDSVVQQHSDSNYIKPYKRTDFVTATFYINKKDSSVCQVMKDSAATKNDRRSFFAQYYANGQLQADLPLDEFGQNNGTATYYFENGNTQNTGVYKHGLKSGLWKNYDEKGQLVSTEEYDANGQHIKATK
jgi:antitoxin component YwqK of YwqJK toxin-antitoxin module